MNTKQVIIIRKDLKMRRGKEIAQGSHASMAWLSNRIKCGGFEDFWKDGKSYISQIEFSPAEKEWLAGAFAKITLQVESEEKLREIYQQAKDAGLEAHLIIDSGKTEFDNIPTATAVGIGPDEIDKIDKITKHLDLY